MEKTRGFRDVRLTARLHKITVALERSPGLSFPKVFEKSGELEAAYRFLGNPQVRPEEILADHYGEVAQAAQSSDLVLLIHDTTDFTYASETPRAGLGRKRSSGNTFFAHTSLVLSAEGRRYPIGVANLETWVRGDEPADEYGRWFRCVQSGQQTLGTANVVHVMDREGDSYTLLSQLVAAQHRFVIRAAHDRLISDEGGARKLRELLLNIECTVHRDARVSKRVDGVRSPKQKQIHPSREARLAKLEISAISTNIPSPKPHPREKKRPGVERPSSLTLNVVRVSEPSPPENETPIEWLLLTTESIDTPENVARIVDYYRARWTIEEYHKVLKTGCAMERRQLSDYEGLRNALAVFMPIACRALALRCEARDFPDAACTIVLESDEIEVLRVLRPKHQFSPNPTNRELLLAVASLGGHIKWNGEPGWSSISHGMQKLLTTVVGWRLAKLQYSRDQS